VAVFPREPWSRCGPKNLGLAVAGLVIGALPQWFVAVALVEAAAWRKLLWRNVGAILLASAVGFLASDNLPLTNEYFYQLATCGPAGNWSDAIFRLGRSRPRPGGSSGGG
jgi:hypothetical protein